MKDVKFLLRLSRMLRLFEEKSTDKGVLSYEGDLEVGKEVYVWDEEGNAVPAPDGEYLTDNEKITVEAGIVKAIEAIDVEPLVEETVVEETVVENQEENEPEMNYEDRIKELEAMIAERDAALSEKEIQIAELEKRIKELEEGTKEVSAEQMSKIRERETSKVNDILKRIRKD